MSLTPKQSERVRYLLEGGWGQAESDDLPEYWTAFDRALGQVESSEELHEFVDRWNWDGGSEPIRRALAHPLCDRGTALMAYWRIDPLFYLKPEHDTRAKVELKLWPDALVHWDMLRDIERRLTSNEFRSARMPYDPTSDRGRDRTKPRERKALPTRVVENPHGTPFTFKRKGPAAEPAVDPRAALPAVVFEAVSGGRPAGT
jgi:hypothetical protein